MYRYRYIIGFVWLGLVSLTWSGLTNTGLIAQPLEANRSVSPPRTQVDGVKLSIFGMTFLENRSLSQSKAVGFRLAQPAYSTHLTTLRTQVDGTFGQIKGRVTTDGLTPLPQINVQALCYNYYNHNKFCKTTTQRTTTDSQGYYTLPHLSPDSYTIVFKDPAKNYLTEYYDKAASADSEEVVTIAISSGQIITNINASLTLGGVITGIVTNEQGKGLSNITVEIYGAGYSPKRATSNDEGMYQITGLKSGLYQLSFKDSARIYVDKYNAQTVTVTASMISSNVNVSLSRGGVIAGNVTYSSGKKLANIKVGAFTYINNKKRWYLDSRTITRTNERGDYRLTGLDSGQYRLVYGDCGGSSNVRGCIFVKTYYPDVTLFEQAQTFNLIKGQVITNINTSLLIDGYISGYVTNAEDGTPIEDIDVWLYAKTENGWQYVKLDDTNKKGRYRFYGLRPNVYRLQFLDIGSRAGDRRNIYAPQYYPNRLNFEQAEPLSVTIDHPLTQTNVALERGGHIIGHVTAADGLTPVWNVYVKAYRETDQGWQADRDTAFDGHGINGLKQIYTTEDGRYDINGLRSGRYRLKFIDESGLYASRYYPDTPKFTEATVISVTTYNTITNINMSLSKPSPTILKIDQPRFARTELPIQITLKPLSNSIVAIGLPSADWQVISQVTTSHGNVVYSPTMVAQLEQQYNGRWWAGRWSSHLTTTIALTVQTSGRDGEYSLRYWAETPDTWLDVPLSVTSERPIRSVAVTSLDYLDRTAAPLVYHYLGWNTIEVRRGVYDWKILDDIIKKARHHHKKLILRIYNPPYWRTVDDAPLGSLSHNPNDWQEWMHRLTARVKTKGYQDVIAGYVIWNEPNIKEQWGNQPPDPAAYMALLKAAYRGAKAGYPAAIIVSAPLAPTADKPNEAINDLTYLERLYDLGLADYTDVIGLSGLGFQHPPAHDSGQADYNFRRLSYLHGIMQAKGDGQHRVWALEVGWLRDSGYDMGTFNPFKVPPDNQKVYLEQAFALARNEWPWLEVASIWNLDFNQFYPPTSAFHWYSILERHSQYLPLIMAD